VKIEQNLSKAVDCIRELKKPRRIYSHQRDREIEVDNLHSNLFGSKEVQIQPMPATGCLKRACDGEEPTSRQEKNVFLFPRSFEVPTSKPIQQDLFVQNIADNCQLTSIEGMKIQSTFLQKEGNSYCRYVAEETQVCDYYLFTAPQNIQKPTIEISSFDQKVGYREAIPNGADFDFGFNRHVLLGQTTDFGGNSYCSQMSMEIALSPESYLQAVLEALEEYPPKAVVPS